MLEMLCEYWDGPISLAIYISDAEAHKFTQFVLESDILSAKTNVGYHVVYKDGVSLGLSNR